MTRSQKNKPCSQQASLSSSHNNPLFISRSLSLSLSLSPRHSVRQAPITLNPKTSKPYRKPKDSEGPACFAAAASLSLGFWSFKVTERRDLVRIRIRLLLRLPLQGFYRVGSSEGFYFNMRGLCTYGMLKGCSIGVLVITSTVY